MGRLLPLLLAFFLVAGCGGEEEEPPPGDLIPEADLSTPMSAAESYARAIETASVSLMHDVMLETERQENMRRRRQMLQSVEARGLKFRVEFEEDTFTRSDDRAEVRAQYYLIGPGESEGSLNETSYVVLVRTPAGEWKYSPRLSAQRTQQWRNAKAEEEAPDGEEGNDDSQPEGAEPEPAGDDGENGE